jgi:hypothetical protein
LNSLSLAYEETRLAILIAAAIKHKQHYSLKKYEIIVVLYFFGEMNFIDRWHKQQCKRNK